MHTPSLSRRKLERASTKEVLSTEQTQPSRKPDDERMKKATITTRNYMQKSTPADIYSKKSNTLQAPKKAPTKNTTRNESPMKSFLKSGPSSVSVKSTRTPAVRKNETKPSIRKSNQLTPKTRTNVTVNSPILNRKPNFSKPGYGDEKVGGVSAVRPSSTADLAGKSKLSELYTRQRSNTRTLDEDEVKVFKPDAVDNNEEMRNLRRKLSAKPKSFYVDFNQEKKEVKKEKDAKSSEEEVSYEDDFESYESDFDSYHSESHSDVSTSPTNGKDSVEEREEELGADSSLDRVQERSSKENEEKMLDSGSYDLRDPQRSAQKIKPVPLDFIMEGAEDGDKKPSLTDEGFQEMSTSSGAPSMKVVHVDVLDRPLFIDFTVSRINRRKRRIFEKLQQRAKDILSMVTLHEMTYTLFEMKPIPYDLYMATFGRSNYTQTAVQTYDDGIDEEVQTDEIENGNKWTQIPVNFSKSDVHLNNKPVREKEEDIFRFSALVNKKEDNCVEDYDDSYKSNPLRIYLEQKDGVGSDQILPKGIFKNKLKQTEYNVDRLKRFLKKAEGRISNILSINAGNTKACNFTGDPKYPFSEGFVKVSVNNTKISFANDLKVSDVIFSRNKTNLLITVHDKSDKCLLKKSFLCVWDITGLQEPVKVLVATDDVTIGRFWGGCDGVVIAALKDGTIHLWDLTEKATWTQDNISEEKPTKLVEIITDKLSQTELDREWNLKNSHVNCEQNSLFRMQSSSYTSSGVNIVSGDSYDSITGLDFLGHMNLHSLQDGGRKVIAQICSMQRIGILTFWSIVQHKSKTNTDQIGKAYWSKLALEKIQTINLSDYLDVYIQESPEKFNETFNLSAAKKRLSNKRRESTTSRENCRPNSTDVRPRSVTSARNRKVFQVINNQNSWEIGIVCCDLKIKRMNNVDNFLIAKNCGEVLCCTRQAGRFNVKRFCVANDTSTITRLELSQNGLPYILAATDCGTVNLCSLNELRVLLTLDCMNKVPKSSEKYKTDHKGRYVGSVATNSTSDVISAVKQKVAVTSLAWSRSNPFDFFALLGNGSLYAWRLTKSDIAARKVEVEATVCVASGDIMALVTSQNEVQIHRLRNDKNEIDYLELYQRYLALL